MCSMMLGFLKQESNKISLDDTINLLPSFIEDSKELQIFGSQNHSNLSSWIGHINSCLSSAKTRLEGVSLLRALVPQCPAEDFQQHCASWVRLLTQSLQSFDSPPVISLVASTLGTILKGASQVTELSREISNSHIAVIVTAALELKSQDSAVDVHSACIQYFPGPCGPFRTRTENFLVQLMSSNQKNDVPLSASRCLALLPRVGGGGQGGIKHVEAWSFYCQKVLTSFRNVLDRLYGESGTESQSGSTHTPLAMPDAPSKEPSRTYTLVRHLKMLSACLQHMLRAEFPEIVKIPVNGILSMCYRVLALNGKMLSKKVSLKWTLLAGSLSTIHSEAFNVLSALISSCRGNLVLHGHMINKLFVQTLGWTMSSQSDEIKQKPYSGLRVSAYTTLETWLETTGACTGIESSSEKLLEQILCDARPLTQTTKLTVTAEDKPAPSLTNKKLSGKGKQKSRTAPAENTSNMMGQQRVDPLANSQVCLASLKVLRCLLLSAGTRVKPDFHKDVQDFVIPFLLRIQQVSPVLTPAPYSSVDCRKALYHVLLSCVIAPHPRWPAPIQCATRLFSRGRQDTSMMVAGFCTEASIICQAIIHPRVPSLQSPLNVAQLDPKRSSSYSTFDLQAGSEHALVDMKDVSGDSAFPRTVDDIVIVSSIGDWRPTPTAKETPTESSSNQNQPEVSSFKMDVQNRDDQEEEEDSSDESEDDKDKEKMEADQGIRDENQIKDSDQKIKDSIQENPENLSQKEPETGSQPQTEAPTVLDSIVSSYGDKDADVPSTSSDDGKNSSQLRRSKRHMAQLSKEARSDKNDAGRGDVNKRMKKEEQRDEDKINEDATQDEVPPEEIADETAMMLASFVDSVPDEV